jgi:hypothetical protein
MEKLDVKDWEKFREKTSSRIDRDEVVLIAELHAKYFNHKMKVPCSCSPKRIQTWINDLNKIYEDRKDT